MNYTIRETCIFCDSKLYESYFNNDYKINICQYAVDIDNDECINIPYNICICNKCKTIQNKYLGDIKKIYETNHGDGTAPIVNKLHSHVCNLLLKNNNIKNIIEIGSSCGILSDLVINNNKNIEYNIIEPTFIGNPNGKIIYNNFYENIDDSKINANTIILSHVFEHFYEPRKILDKISLNENIEFFYLINPDLEYCITDDVYHLFNTEHTYYVDNNFIINLFRLYGFELMELENFNNHSTIFIFNKNKNLINIEKNINFENKIIPIDRFFKNIFTRVNEANRIINEQNHKNIYIWPASIHFSYLNIFGLSNNIIGLLDNSIYKIGKKMYGTNLEIYSFDNIVEQNTKHTLIIMMGPKFHVEIMEKIKNADNIEFVWL